MTDLQPFFEAHAVHHFNVFEKALYLELIGLSIFEKVLPDNTFCGGDLGLRSRLGICQTVLRNARLRLKEAGLIDFVGGNGRAQKTTYLLIKVLSGNTFCKKIPKSPIIYNNNLNNSYNLNNTNKLNIIINKKKEKINKKEKKQNFEIQIETQTLTPEIIHLNPPQSIQNEKLIDNTFEQIIIENNTTKPQNQNPKQPFTPPTETDVKNHLEAEAVPDLDLDLFLTKFFGHYGGNGWMVGKNKMVSWTHCVATFLGNQGYKKENKKWVKINQTNGKSNTITHNDRVTEQQNKLRNAHLAEVRQCIRTEGRDYALRHYGAGDVCFVENQPNINHPTSRQNEPRIIQGNQN
jgi:hypothetical protein